MHQGIFLRTISSPKKHCREELRLSRSFTIVEKRFAREIACTTTRESSCNARLARCNVEYLIGIGCETSSPLLFCRLGRIVLRAQYLSAPFAPLCGNVIALLCDRTARIWKYFASRCKSVTYIPLFVQLVKN